MNIRKTFTHQKGFTIVELMIATVVFSTILVVITAGVVAFSNQYYRGVNVSATQNTARNIIDSISQSVQFSGADIQETGTNNYFCAGGYVYTFSNKNQQFTGSTTAANPGLYRTRLGVTCQASTAAGGTQLLTNRQRLTQLSLTKIGELYEVKVGVAYGDDDVLCSTDSGVTVGNCSGNSTLSAATLEGLFNSPEKLSCRNGASSPYCAISTLKTVVENRL